MDRSHRPALRFDGYSSVENSPHCASATKCLQSGVTIVRLASEYANCKEVSCQTPRLDSELKSQGWNSMASVTFSPDPAASSHSDSRSITVHYCLNDTVPICFSSVPSL